MKNLYLLFLICSFCIGTSQTLTQSFNEPVLFDQELTISIDTSAYSSGMPIALTGSNTNWNFIHLQAKFPTFITDYDPPALYTASVNFPGATLVQSEAGALNVFIKSVKTPTTQTEVLGFSSTSLSCTFTNSAIAALYPISFGSTNTDNIAGSFTLGTISGNCSGKITTVADGTGTLTLPDGFVYKNVIRVKSVQTITASQGILPVGTIKQTVIKYFDMSEKFAVLTINYNSTALAFGTPTVSGYATGLKKSFAGINEKTLLTQVSFYPNPASNDIKVVNSGSSALKVKLVNCLGQEVAQFNAVDPQSSCTINVSELSPGMYQLIFDNGSSRRAEKLLIQTSR